MPRALWTPTRVSLVYRLQQAYSPLKDCIFSGGDVVCFTAVPFMDQDPIMQNADTGRTSECYPITQQRHEKPGQVERGLQENNSTDHEGEQTPLCTHCQLSLELDWRGGLQLHPRVSALRDLSANLYLTYLEAQHPANEGW